MMKTFKLFTHPFILTATLSNCSSYDNIQIRDELNELKIQVQRLDNWCDVTNSQITALEGLVSALEKNDYITDVIPKNVSIGYSAFSKSTALTSVDRPMVTKIDRYAFVFLQIPPHNGDP